LHQENRLPHALAFMGPQGIGKRELAREFAKLVLCQQPEGNSICGLCHACQLIHANSHPDFWTLSPEEGSQTIKIDQVRLLSEFIQNTSHQGGFRVVIIQPATAMNTNAANALLKTLEEPTPNTLLILISDQKQPLLPTILSRCQQVHMTAPTPQQAQLWLAGQKPEVEWQGILAATHYAPLLAMEWQEQGVWAAYQSFTQDLYALSQGEADPLQLALTWKETNMLWAFDLFFGWLLKLMWAKQLPSDEPSLAEVADHVSMAYLLEFTDYLQKIRGEVLGPYNLNPQLLLESIFIRWVQYVSR
jgi:DNA polymerase-3 subunit delta'